MVRETRHLWVGNLPENIREDRIREHFKRYGRVQSVKLLPRGKEDEASTGLSATVAFMDLKSASKAHNMEQKLDERCLSTEYYEPSIPGSASAPLYAAPPRFPHGVPEEHAAFDRTSLFYERGGGDGYLRRGGHPPGAGGYHVVAGDPMRGRGGRDRIYRNGPLPHPQFIDRPPPPHHRPLVANAWNYEAPPSVRYPVAPPVVEPVYPEERREPPPVVHKKRPKSRSGSESGSNTISSRSRSRSRSRSSSSSTNSRSSSCSSATSSAVEGSPHSSRTARSGRAGGATVQSTVSAPHTNNASPAVHSEDRRPLAICVRNLPIRSSDTSLKDGLFHEYKKHGKVTWVKVVGQGTDRYALVCFKKPEDVEKALEVSHDKQFFGCKIEVASYQGYDVDDNESRPYEAELDEYHPKATRTLFIGNLEKDVTASELRKQFEQFGEIIEIDIKKQGAISSYAFCQYADIASVVKAMRTMDGEHLGNNRIKLGFGKSMPTNCVWVDGVADNVTEKYLNLQFNQFGSISHVTIDRERGHALIYFEQIPYAQEAVRDMRGVTLRGRKLQVDFASRECQETFYEHLEKQGNAVVGGERPWDRYDNNREVQASRFETTVVVPGARFTRYEAGAAPRPRPPVGTGYVRTANNAAVSPATTPGPPAGLTRVPPRGGPRVPGQRYAEYYDNAEYPERRYSRNYDEVSPGSPTGHDDLFDHADYGYCPRTSPSAASADRSVAVVTDKVAPEDEGYKRLQSVVVSDVISPPLPPPDMRHLQKERVHLLEQLEECPSSGDDDVAPKKRPKVVDCTEPGMSNNTNCFDAANHDPPLLLMTTHNHRKSITEIRRLSDASLKHCSRRPSTDSSSRPMDMPSSYAPHPVCKRRKTGSSASEGEDRLGGCSRKHGHHHHHHSGELESMDGSRPGTPLCDERPENLLPPTEPRRPRERAAEGPLSLPLPRFASQVLTARVLAGKPIIASPPNITSPRIPVAHPPPSPSPTQAPPPSSPPPRPPSLPSSSSSDSEQGPRSPTWEERIRSLDEKYEKWSGSRNIQAPSETIAKLDAAGDRFRFRHKLLDLNELKPSDNVKSVLAKPSVFDEDSKRLENVGDKVEPKEFVPFKGAGCFQSLRIKTECGTPVNAPTAAAVSFPSPAIPPRLVNMPSPLHSPNQPSHKSPFSTGTPTTPTVPKVMPMSPGVSPTASTPPCKSTPIPKTGALSPRAAGSNIPAAKGLQYPFPSHPPVVPTTSVATTTASATNVIALVSVSVTTASVSVFNAEVPRTCAVKPVCVPVHQNDPRSRVAPTVLTLTTATATKPSPEVTCRIQVPQKVDTSAYATASVKVLVPLNSRLAGCAKPVATVLSPTAVSATVSEVSRTSPVKHLASAISDDVVTRLPNVSSFPSQPVASGPTTCTTPLGSVKKPCATTVAPSLPPRISTAGITRSVTTPTDVPTSSTSVPASPRLATKPSEQSAKSFSSLPARPDPVQTNVCIPPTATVCDMSGVVSLTCSPTVATTSIVMAVTPTSTSTTAVLLVTMPTAAVTTPVSTTTNMPVTIVEQAKHSQKPKSVSNPKPQPPSIKKDSAPSLPVKKEKDDLKITSSHRSKSLEEKKDKKESPAVVCQRRESEGVDRRAEKEKRRDKETSDTWESKRKEKELEIERRKEWETSESEREKKKECAEVEKDRRKESLITERLGSSDKDCSDKTDKEKPSENECSDVIPKKKDFPEDRCKEARAIESTVKERWKDKEGHVDKEKRRENHIDHSRDKEVTESKVHVAEHSVRKDTEPAELLDRRKTPETPNETCERRKEKDISENTQRRKSMDGSEKRKSRDSPENVDRRKEREQNHVEKRKEREPTEVVEKKKEHDTAEMTERRKDRDSGDTEEKRKERRRERANSVQSPAPIGSKRRISSQDGQEVNSEVKRPKLAERRDSKDSGRSSSSSSKRGTHHSFAKPHDDKTKHDAERKRHDHDKSREKLKKKNRDAPKPGKETVEERETSTSPRLVKRKEDSDSEDKDELKHRHQKREMSEKKKLMKEDSAPSEACDEKARSAKKDREKRGSSEKRKEDSQSPVKDEQKSIKKESRIHKMSNSDTDSDDEDGPKKHSIFDIVDDGPAYISMYDKVKARSTKNMQKQEEEKRQEKMREKFSLLKASRAKREEKKRSTSWDEDSDSDMDPELRRAKRAGKPVISSSSEDETNRRPSYDADDSKSGKTSVKKDDLGLGDSDSDSHHRGSKSINRHDDEGNSMKHLVSAMRKGSRAKLISDTSDDDVHVEPYKGNHLTELYSAESDADQGFADVDDRHPSLKKSSIKNHKLNKSVMDSLSEESNNRKPIVDISKCSKEKSSSHKKTLPKNKTLKGLDWSDEEKGKTVSETGKSDLFDEDKLAAIFKPKLNNKAKSVNAAFNSSDEEHTRKLLTDAVKAEIFGDDKTPNFAKKSNNRTKMIKRSLDSSDDDISRKHLSSTPKMDMKAVIKNKCIKNSPESFDEESHHDKVAMFGEITPSEKYNSHKNMVQAAFTEGDQMLITPPQMDKKSSFFSNSIDKSVDLGRKKTHKKKQKRIRDLQSSNEGPTKAREITENHSDTKVKSEKKHKRERRKSDHGEDKVNKVHKKKSLKQDPIVAKPENSIKRDEKMEDIFGPISDDSESSISTVGKVLPPIHNNGGRPLDKLPNKWQVSMIYGSDSDSVDRTTPNIVTTPVRATEKDRKRRDKKRRDRKAREEESAGAELAEAGRALEAKLMGTNNYMSADTIKREPSEDNSPRFNDEEGTLVTTPVLQEKSKDKEKKKKRKKSKEEKQSKHHHHHHHDKSNKTSIDSKSTASEDASLPILTSPSLPSLDVIHTEVTPKLTPVTLTVTPPTVNSISCKISPRSVDKKKTDKFIPGFGVAMDAAIHETAVKSISEFEATKPQAPPKVDLAKKAAGNTPKESDDTEGDEEKPRVAISQEETEDAVAALLGESFGADFADCYGTDGNGSPHHVTSGTNLPQLQTDEEEETRQAVEGLIDMKPDTPQSEPDLQIDTDTEDDNDGFLGLGFSRDDNRSRSSDNIDFSKPPKTPDMPASYYRQQKSDAELSVAAKTPTTPEHLPVPPTYPKPIPLKEEPIEGPSPKPITVPTSIAVVANQPSRVAEEAKKETMSVVKEESTDTVDVDVPKLVGLVPVEAPNKPVIPPTIVLEKPVVPTVEKPVVHLKTEVEPDKTVPFNELLRDKLSVPTPSVIKAPSPTPMKVPNNLPLESVIKCQELRKEDLAKERVPLIDNVIQEFKPYRFEDSSAKKDPIPIKDDNKLVNNIDFGRSEKARETVSTVNQEDDFSEPETDLKSDSDFVTNLLKSDSLTRGMSIDDNTPDAEKAESSFEPFREKNAEAITVIKEVDPHQAKLEQFASQKPLTTGKENHVDFMTDVIRADTGFWATKEVNIDSVIKKVDALCSAEEDTPSQQPWFNPVKEEPKPHEVAHVEPKTEVAKPVEAEKPAAVKVEPTALAAESAAHVLDVPALPMRARSEERLSTLAAELLTPDADSRLQSGSSPEDDQSEATTPRATQKGRRGAGGRRKAQSRVANNVTTRRTRLGQKTPEGAAAVAGTSPRRGGRPPKGANRSLDPSFANRNKLPADVYEFHDDSEDEGTGGGDKNRPRLVLTIKSPVAGASANAGEPPAVATAKPAEVATTKVPELAKPVETVKLPEVAKPVEVVKAVVISKTAETVPETSKPAETVKAVEIVKPLEIVKPVEAVKAAEIVKPMEMVKAVEATKTAETSKAAETVEEATASPAANTRKSRRLQERDGSRSTVDDTIEDVVRGAAPLTRAAAATLAASTRRLAKQPPLAVPPPRAGSQPLEPRKSPRGGNKRQTQQRTSESQDESDNKSKTDDSPLTIARPAEIAVKEVETKPDVAVKESPAAAPTTETATPKPAIVLTKPVAVIPPGMMLKPRAPGESEEPMTLIDPVTGLLIPMRESEEGQYIPVASTGGRSLPESLDSGNMALASRMRSQGLTPAGLPVQVPVISKSPGLPVAKSAEVKPIPKAHAVQPTVVQAPTIAKPALSTVPQPATAPLPPSALPVNLQVQSKPQTSVQPMKNAVQPQIKITHPPVGTVYPPNKLQIPPKVAVAHTPLIAKVPPHMQGPLMPNSPKPHFQGPPVSNSPKPHMQGPQMPNSPKPHFQGPPVASSPKPHLQGPPMPNSPKPQLQGPPMPNSPKPHLQGPPMPNSPKPQLQGPPVANSPKAHFQGPPMPNSPKAHHLQPSSLKPPPQAVSPQNMITAHLPQQAHMNKTMLQHPGVANMAPSQKGHLLQAPRSASPAVHATASPPKAHQGLGPPPILTGAVASPPLKASQQPVVTGASSSRAAVPKAQVPNLPGSHPSPHVKNVMIPPKVEVSMGGCIVVPSASPQPRGQVMQAGMPVPAYEASLGDVQRVFPHPLRAASHEMPPHYVHPSLMYQQYYGAAHIPYHLTPGGVRSPMMPGMDAKLDPESEEARGSSPPLELRRPAAGVTHSLQSPHDRLTDSPQVATVYMHGSRMPHYTPRYYETEPPPAHVRANRHHPLPGTEAPPTQPMMQVATPQHANQVPPEADSLRMLLLRYPVMWQGLLALKGDQAAVQMHFVFGNQHVASDSLPCNSDGSTPPLRIAQRMRLEQTQVEGVARKMQMDNEHCMLLALPCGRDQMDVIQQYNNLQTGFITYLQQKQAAGIVNIAAPGSQQAAYVVHIFPSCDFANENLARIAPDLLHRVANIAHLLVVIATVKAEQASPLLTDTQHPTASLQLCNDPTNVPLRGIFPRQ